MLAGNLIAHCDWLRVEGKYACYALAVRDGRVLGGAPYGMKVIGSLRRFDDVVEKLLSMGQKLDLLPVPKAVSYGAKS